MIISALLIQWYSFIPFVLSVHGQCTQKTIHKKKIRSCRSQVLIVTCPSISSKRNDSKLHSQRNRNEMIVSKMFARSQVVVVYRKSYIIYRNGIYYYFWTEFDCPVQWVLIQIKKEYRTINFRKMIEPANHFRQILKCKPIAYAYE